MYGGIFNYPLYNSLKFCLKIEIFNNLKCKNKNALLYGKNNINKNPKKVFSLLNSVFLKIYHDEIEDFALKNVTLLQ